MLLPARLTAPLAIAALLIMAPAGASAQFEAGLLVGGTAYVGELTPTQTSRYLDESRLAVGAFGRYQFATHAAVRLGYSYLSVEGSDLTRPTSRTRNHRFVTDIHEVAASLEYYLLGADRRLAPYLSLGLGAFRYNPTTDFQGQRYDLRPLRTEAQGSEGFDDPYGTWAFAVPLGGGLRFEALPQLLLGVEVIARYTPVDHLDDISREFYVPLEQLAVLNGPEVGPLSAELSYRTDEISAGARPTPGVTRRANPETNDYYVTAQLTMSYRFGPTSTLRSGPRRSGKPIDCPKF